MHTARSRTQVRCWRWAERCHNVPSPLAGEGQGGGYNSAASGFLSNDPANPAKCCSPLSVSSLGRDSSSALRRHPSPCPSPARGEGTVWHAPSHLTRSLGSHGAVKSTLRIWYDDP